MFEFAPLSHHSLLVELLHVHILLLLDLAIMLFFD